MLVPEVDVHQLATELQAGATLLDVRNPDEWQEARVPGVPLIPLAELPARIDEVPGGEPLYVICAVGARSAKAVELLTANGITAVNVAGGTRGWIDAGYPIDAGPG